MRLMGQCSAPSSQPTAGLPLSLFDSHIIAAATMKRHSVKTFWNASPDDVLQSLSVCSAGPRLEAQYSPRIVSCFPSILRPLTRSVLARTAFRASFCEIAE
jgi:hypothetical protein